MLEYILRVYPLSKERVLNAQKIIAAADCSIVEDTNSNAYDTFVAALKAARGKDVVHLEDDIMLCRNFTERVEGFVARNKSNVVNFFSRGLNTETRYASGSSFIYTQCFYVSRAISDSLYEYSLSWYRRTEHPTGIDYMVGDFLKSRKMRYLVHVPSLVQHLPFKSVIDKRRSTKRQSKTFEGHYADSF